MNLNIQESLDKLLVYIETENYKGYDPYDTLNSWVPFKFFGRWSAAIATQIQKRNPINIRPLLGIKKEYNPKAMGLFLQIYSILYQKTNKNEFLERAEFFFNWLKENYSKGYSGSCWGYNFPWANSEHYYNSFTPSAVVTGFVCKGIYEYYKITSDNTARHIILDVTKFINKDLHWYKDETGICISYTPIKRDICYNASLLAAEILSMNSELNGNEQDKQNAIKAIDFVIARQKQNGLWAYSEDKNGKERIQTDFHQGYVLESIYGIKKRLCIDNDRWKTALYKGIEFYLQKQFYNNGRSLWRVPKVFPVEIHNQTQGIITFLKLKEYFSNTEEFAHIIAKWTINNMQSKDGHFYYQIFKYHKHKISYMRWSNAWMLLALSMLMKEEK